MKKSWLLLPIILAGMGWAFLPSSYSVRYVVTAAISVDGELYSGSKVWEMTIHPKATMGNALPYSISMRGEAIEIETAKLGTVYVLRASSVAPSSQAYGAYLIRCLPPGTSFAQWKDAFKSLRGICAVPHPLPKAVIFENSGNPASLVVVSENTNKISGAAHIVSMSVQVTNRIVSETILKKIPWIDEMDPLADIVTGEVLKPYGSTLLNRIYVRDFKAEN